MKSLALILLAILFLGSLHSCQQEVSFPLPGKDSTAAIDSGKIIQITYESDSLRVVNNIQYDTAGRKINIYEDDTTTANPYDQLVTRYSYNSAGYLQKYEELGDPMSVRTIEFLRDGANKLNRIVVNSMQMGGMEYDTFALSYHNTGAYTVLYMVNLDSATKAGRQWTMYNSSNQYESVINKDYDSAAGPYYSFCRQTFSYNTDGTLQQHTKADTFSYVPPVQQAITTNYTSYEQNVKPTLSNLFKTIMGKDGYLFELQELVHPFLTVLTNNLPSPPDLYEEDLFFANVKPHKTIQLSLTEPIVFQDNWQFDYTKDASNRIKLIQLKRNNVLYESWKIKYAL